MKLDRLTLINFKGVRDLTLELNGQDAVVLGDNGVGKTTIADAFTWLLFDKDIANKKDFEVKTLDKDNRPIPGLNHEVEGVLDLDGRKLTLRKVYVEKWTKRRGQAQAEFTGNTTDYYIDGVPKPKKEYDACIAGIADESIFKLLTSPTYFNEALHWTERRRILLEVCGDISDEGVIASDKALSKLPDILQGRKIDDHRKVIAARRAEINKELGKIPVRIDEATRALPDISGLSEHKILADIANLKARKAEKDHEKARIEAGGEVADRKKQLAEVETEILRMKNDHRIAQDEKASELRKNLNLAKTEAGNKETEIAQIDRKISFYQDEIMSLDAKRDKLRIRWHEVNSQVFEFIQDTVCPTCGQNLPAEQLTAAREKALASFNLAKSQQLETISGEGKAAKIRSEELQGEIETLKASLAQAADELRQINVLIEGISGKIKTIQESETPITDNPIYIQKLQSKTNIEKMIAQLQTGNQEAIDRVNHEIADLGLAIAEMESDAAKIKRHNDGQKRIEELKTQERTLAAEFERLEGEAFLCEQFIRAKVAMLEERINSKFKLARFKMFDQQINGGLSECCETLYDGIPYSSNLNRGHKIIVGMDIIRTLAEHFKFTAPIFADNAESVTDLPEMNAQLIRLVKPEIETEEDRRRYGKLVVKIEKQKNLKEAV
ncbi:MAG: chromosome segregation protein [Pelotomaculum sp. PtaB.Bin104]|nr:MAG: chromosome segregation protein [Pelotomaculum sp. PtaB.Bin104]